MDFFLISSIILRASNFLNYTGDFFLSLSLHDIARKYTRKTRASSRKSTLEESDVLDTDAAQHAN